MKHLLSLVLLFFSVGLWAQTPPVQTVDYVDLDRYLGTWYEVASIPQSFQKKCVKNSQAVYSRVTDTRIKVVNSCRTKSGKTDVATGRAKVVDRDTNAKLRVTFVKLLYWVFAFGGNYWVIDLAPDYSYAVVGDPKREYAWILSRSRGISPESLATAVESLKANGYDTCKLLTTVQDGGFQQRKPVCEVAKE